MEDDQQQQDQQQPTEHPPTECGCPVCQPERFAGREFTESRAIHLCQRCFTQTCKTPVGE